MAIVAGSQIDIGRGLLAALTALTGTRARGTVDVDLAGNPSAEVIAGNYLIPIINGQARTDLVFKVAPKADGSMKWALPADGPLELVSNVGGARFNLPQGTELYWDPPLAGLGRKVVVRAGGIAGGVQPSSPISLLDLQLYEDAGVTGLELFRTGIKAYPAVVAAWLESEPADGLATSSLRRGASRVGEGSQLYTEIWQVNIFVTNKQSEAARRAEGLMLLDEVTSLLTDVQTVDGVVLSHPSGIQIRSRQRVTGLPREVFQTHQVYSLEIATTGNYVRHDGRTWADLLKFRLDVPKYDEEGTDLPLVVNNLVENPHDP